MKKVKWLICVLSLAAVFSLTACTNEQSAETDMTPKQIVQTIIESQTELPELNEAETDELNIWVTNYYLINSEEVSGGAIFYAEGAEVSEIAVLVLTDSKAASTAKTALTEYIANRAELFGYYEPQQAAIARSSIAVANGNYVALLICKDTAAAKTAFLSCFGKSENNAASGGNENTDKPTENNPSVNEPSDNKPAENPPSDTEPPVTEPDDNKQTETVPPVTEPDDNKPSETIPPENENTDNTQNNPAIAEGYNELAILQAYKTGNEAFLSAKNKQILTAAKNVISQKITSGMNDYQKELAIHDYITTWSNFDWAVLGHGAVAEDSKTPYGVLINRNAMCHGFSSCFQLFMKMLDIECVTVFSTSSGSTPHSWNVVKIEGDWYCVDTAWDSTSGHAYFNVTSQYLKNRGYRWDEKSVPEAQGTKYAYKR